MRKKFAMRWRRSCLRRGVEITSEGMVFSKKELKESGWSRKDNGYQIKATYKRNKYSVADDDMLKAYKLLSWCMDVEDEEEADPDGIHTIGGIWLSDTGKSEWIRE